MQIRLNGEPFELPERAGEATLGDLVQAVGLTGRRLAVEVNGELVPRSQHPVFPLVAGDRVEIVQAIGGG